MTTNLKKTIANNLAIATVLLSSGMPFAATIAPANALSKSEANETSIVSQSPQKSITIAKHIGIHFPVGGEKEDRVKKKSHMKTSFTLNSSGNLKATTRTWSRRKLSGFTGGVFIVLTDGSKNPVWTSKQHRYGVNGRWLGTSDRTEKWQATVPKRILPRVRGYAIVQQHTPTRRVWKWIGSNLKTIVKIVELFSSNDQSNQTSGGGSSGTNSGGGSGGSSTTLPTNPPIK
ncbi:MAG: hypothetical protein MJK14_28215 [Rivularia sp. ALOHA_DT_140]|nr:hypothetical protein [Rivularia sp. ALOHA_DT_140]